MNGWLAFDSFGALLTPGRRHLCQVGRDKSSTILSTKRPAVPASIRRYLFSLSVRRSINAVSCLALSRHRLEIALHGLGVQAILVFNCDRCQRPLVHLKFLVGMLDEDRRENAKGGSAGDHQPGYGWRPSPRGRVPCRRLVRPNYARQ